MQGLLDRLVRSVDGAQSAILLDALGEVVIEAGERAYRHRLIGAYQGIALSTAQRTSENYAIGAIEYILCRYVWGNVILRPLKDGYYLIICMGSDANIAQGLYRSAEARARIDVEL